MAVISSDQITLVNVSDAYSVTLSRESYIFIGNGDGVPAGKKCTTEVTAYRGKDQCSAITITEKQITCPTGISATVSGNIESHCYFYHDRHYYAAMRSHYSDYC